MNAIIDTDNNETAQDETSNCVSMFREVRRFQLCGLTLPFLCEEVIAPITTLEPNTAYTPDATIR